MNLSAPWTECPLVGVTMNPIRGTKDAYHSFVDLCIVRSFNGKHETVVDCRTRASDEDHWLGSFSDREMRQFKLDGMSYAREAKKVGPILAGLHQFVAGCIPVSANVRLCRDLLCRAARHAEGAGIRVERTNVFLLREKSRWIDIGLWRRTAERRKLPFAEPFCAIDVKPRVRVESMLDRVPLLAKSLDIDPKWTIKELLDWQDELIPF
jgi:hypothetical protein